METRSISLTTRAVEETATGFEFDALAVPYDVFSEIAPGYFEKIPQEAITLAETGVKLRLEHLETIGLVIDTRSESDGLYITGRISKTASGIDAATLIRDGAISGLSIGFRQLADPEITQTEETVQIIQRSIQIDEVSLVTFPAYPQTEIISIRNRKETPMTVEAPDATPIDSTTSAVIQGLESAVDRLERQFSTLTDRLTPQTPETDFNFRSYGEFVKAVVGDEELARRSYSGITTADDKTNRPAWVDRVVDRMTAKMRLTNLFTHTFDLPKNGMSIEFPQFGEDSIVVQKQGTEGADLPFGKITLTTGNAPVNTFGGAARVTLQQIERGSAQYLSTLFSRMAVHYAASIENATKELFAATVTSQLEKTKLDPKKAGTALTVNDLIALFIDAAQYFEDSDMLLEGIAVSPEIFKYLATLEESPKALKFKNAPDRSQGTISIPSLSGSFATLPVSIAPGKDTIAFYSSDALVVQEAPGAPFRLQDETALNLSKDFAIYGYAAHYVPDTAGILPVKLTPAG
ncbi:HK97 family phage prohead protease [Arcanobacterium canis]